MSSYATEIHGSVVIGVLKHMGNQVYTVLLTNTH